MLKLKDRVEQLEHDLKDTLPILNNHNDMLEMLINAQRALAKEIYDLKKPSKIFIPK